MSWPAAVLVVAALVLLVPGLLPGAAGLLCPVGVAAAQSDDCRDQHATITAQAGQIEQLQATLAAQTTQIAALEATQAAQPGALSAVVTRAMQVTPGTTPQLLPPPSDTPSPTATFGAQAAVVPVPGDIRIIEVRSPGRLAAEAVVIENVGRSVNIGGWTLSSDSGVRYIFPARMLLSDSTLTLRSGEGRESETTLYWERDAAAWQRGDRLTLTDNDGKPVAVYTVP